MSVFRVQRVLAAFFLTTVASLFAPASSRAQSFQYPPYGALRGRMVSRDGLFHVQRYRWGNGITPEGAAVLVHAIDVAGTMVPALVTGGAKRSADEEEPATRSRSRSDWPGWDDYTVEQRAANELLRRTARLVDYQPPGPGKVEDGKPPVAIEQLLKKYNAPEGNPWGNGETGGSGDLDRPALERLLKQYRAPEGNPWEKEK